jgi:hypothetical protein
VAVGGFLVVDNRIICTPLILKVYSTYVPKVARCNLFECSRKLHVFTSLDVATQFSQTDI